MRRRNKTQWQSERDPELAIISHYGKPKMRYDKFKYNVVFGLENTLSSTASITRATEPGITNNHFPDTANFFQSALFGGGGKDHIKGWTTGLARANRQISKEFLSLLYSRHLCFLNNEVLEEFLRQIGGNVVFVESIAILQRGEELRTDHDLCYAMLSRATRLANLELPWFDRDSWWIRDWDYDLDDDETQIRCRFSKVIDDNPLRLTGKERADIFFPSTQVCFKSMCRQGKRWENVLSLAKGREVKWGFVNCVYDPNEFSEGINRLLDDNEPQWPLRGGDCQ